MVHSLELGKSDAADAALDMSDNPVRALRLAESYAKQGSRLRARKEWNDTMELGWKTQGDAACRRIGVRPTDYR